MDTLPHLDPESTAILRKCETCRATLAELYRFMFAAREIDLLEEQYVARGEAFFHVSGAGHEAVAALNPHLIAEDYLHCHYRDKALMLARGISPEMFFYSLFCKDASHSRGRQMSAHMGDRPTNILSLVGPVGNNALQAVGIAAEIKSHPRNPVVVCAMGDGTTQQGEVLEAIAEAVRRNLPVLFLIEDNRYAISTVTARKTFYHLPDELADRFYGLPIHQVDGRDAIHCFREFGSLVAGMRKTRGPALVRMSVSRLTNHTNADDQTLYRDEKEIEHARRENDPVKVLRLCLEASGMEPGEMERVHEEIRARVRDAAKKAQYSRDPIACFHAKKPLPPHLYEADREYGGQSSPNRLTMLLAIRKVLQERLQNDPRVTLYGEDIEDPKGDVFGITKGLSRAFPDRVTNAPLSESTIVGASIGRALAGGRPVGFLQFADFLPLAFNQIASELGSMYWRTDGAWQCPVILMVTCGGYRPGLGPFHAQSFESIAVHTPGIDVAMPSNAADAAGILNAAFKSGRPTLFFYPKSCLNLVDAASTTSPDTERHFVPVGKARIARQGTDITFIAYGNGVPLCLKAAETLETAGIASEVIDLRWLSPLDEAAILRSSGKTGRAVVVHEDNHTCGMGGEILAVIAEKSETPVQVRRVTRADTFVPCNFGNQLEVLPSYKRILEAAADLLKIDLEWSNPAPTDEGSFIVEAMGSGPSDETLTVLSLEAAKGATVEIGQLLAVLEASKAAYELEAPVSGMIEEVYVGEDQDVLVGAPLFRIRLRPENLPAPKPITREEPLQAILRRRESESSLPATQGKVTATRISRVGLQGVVTALPSRRISNEDVVSLMPGRSASDITELTGIETRHWAGADEDALTLATRAAAEVLAACQTDIRDIDAIIVCTGTPTEVTPSLACQLLYALAGDQHECPAYDISAACSGYLYGLQNAYLYLQSHPDARVLLVTSEILSRLIDPRDFVTGILFSDGATATVLCGENHLDGCSFLVHEPELSGRGEALETLFVPAMSSGAKIRMEGKRVFSEAVKKMPAILHQCCEAQGIRAEDLDLIIPHQANQRILDAIGKKLGAPEKVASNIRHHGNTSSNSIPIYLAENWADIQRKKTIALTAFGGGFTYGAAILERYLTPGNGK